MQARLAMLKTDMMMAQNFRLLRIDSRRQKFSGPFSLEPLPIATEARERLRTLTFWSGLKTWRKPRLL